MKQTWILGIVLSLLVSLLAGCAPDTPPTNSTPTDTTAPTESTAAPLEKLTQRVYRSGPFSEGLAVAVTGSANGRACVINKNGEILFDLPVPLASGSEVVNAKFVNGLLAIGGGLCDTQGKMTFPEDVGAHKFYTPALAGGFILAQITPESSPKIGILNTQMEWIVEPSEALYEKLCDAQGNLLLKNDEEVRYETERNFYFEGYLLMEGMSEWLELSTGNLIPYEETGLQYPSYTWFSTTANDYLDRTGKVRLDLSRHKKRENWTYIPFRNGLSILLLNDRASTGSEPYSFSMIDEAGTLLFDAVSLPGGQEPAFQWDQEYIVVEIPKSATGLLAQIYSKDGALVSQLYRDDLARISAPYTCKDYNIVYNDGVIVITGFSTSLPLYVWYFTPALQPLF